MLLIVEESVSCHEPVEPLKVKLGIVLPPVAMVCTVADVEMKLMVPIPVSVTVAPELTDRATLPAPAVASPNLKTDVVVANAIVPED